MKKNPTSKKLKDKLKKKPPKSSSTNSSSGIAAKDSWKVFNKISDNYDKTNRVLSWGIDKAWRKQVVSFIPNSPNMKLIDLASGTGDLLMAILEAKKNIGKAIAFDLAQKMLLLGEKKMLKKDYFSKVSFTVGSALSIPFQEESFDIATMSFGIRNTGDTQKTLSEIYRVLKRNGIVLILEFSLPSNFFLRNLYLLYFRYILPFIGGLITKEYQAYRYLNQSVENFPFGKDFLDLMRKSYFINCQAIPLSGGICTLYLGHK